MAQGDILYRAAAVWKRLAASTAGRVLHTNGAGADPTWAAVNLASEVTGDLPVTNLAGGSGASNTTFWRGDGSWSAATGTGGGTVTNTGTLTAGQLIKGNGGSDVTVGDLSGDVTTSGSLATTLANTAVTPGTYTNADITVDSKGRITAAASGELDYVEFTSPLSVTATTEGTAQTVVSSNSVAYDGSTVVLIDFFAMQARPDTTAAARILSLWLYEDSSSLGRIAAFVTPAAAGDNKPVRLTRRLTPSNASHTYSIRASVSAATGLVGAGTGGTGVDLPGFIRITRA